MSYVPARQHPSGTGRPLEGKLSFAQTVEQRPRVATQRHFLIAPSLARLIQRDRGTAGRIAEGHFPARLDRRQLVRVEQERSVLILLAQGEDGQFTEEQVDLPQSHAEALMDVAAGIIVFDRTGLSLGGDIEAVLDRFIRPDGLNILTVTILGDPHTFAPLLWFGLEVTDEPAFAAPELALGGSPRIDGMELSDAALNALLDTLEGNTFYHLRPTLQTRVRE